MKKARFRPSVRNLEDRTTPAISASVSGGILTVAGSASNAANTIKVASTGASSFQVFDGANSIGTFNASNLTVNLTAATDNLDIDLQGHTLAGTVLLNLGDGANNVSIHSGDILGDLTINGGSGNDQIDLLALTVGSIQAPSSVVANLDGGDTDILYVGFQSTITGFLNSNEANYVTVDFGATVEGSVVAAGDYSPNFLDISGHVGNNILFYSPGSTSVNLVMGAQSSIAGNIGVYGGSGDDTVVVDLGGITMTGSVAVDLDAGDNSLIVRSGDILNGLRVTGKDGTDLVQVLNTIVGTAANPINSSVELGAGANDRLYVGFETIFNGFLFTDGVNHVNVDDDAVVSGSLVVSGDNSENFVDVGGDIGINVLFYSPGSTTATVLVRETTNIGGNIGVYGGDGDDTLFVDLGGNTLAGSIGSTLNGGNDKLVIRSGDVQNGINVFAGDGNDTVHFLNVVVGTTANPANADINLAGGFDSLYVGNGSIIHGNLITRRVNHVNVDVGNTIDGQLFVCGDVGSNLIDVGGNVGGNITFKGATSGVVQVLFRGGSNVGGNLIVTGGRFSDGVDIDLNGTTFAGSIVVYAANGGDSISIHGGDVLGDIFASGGAGNDNVAIRATNVGTAANEKNVSVDLAGGIDTFLISAQSHVSGNAYVSNANIVTLDYFSSVEKSFILKTDTLRTVADVSGKVGIDVKYNGASDSVSGHQLRIGPNAEIGRDVVFSGGNLADLLIVDADSSTGVGAKIGRNLTVETRGGSDTVVVATGVTMGGRSAFDLGSGNDSLRFGGTTGSGSGTAFVVDAGDGNDAVQLLAGTTFKGTGGVRLGSGADRLTMPVPKMTFDFLFAALGGSGADTLVRNGNTGFAFAEFESIV